MCLPHNVTDKKETEFFRKKKKKNDVHAPAIFASTLIIVPMEFYAMITHGFLRASHGHWIIYTSLVSTITTFLFGLFAFLV